VLRVANLFIAIIRGALAAVLTSIISTVIVMSRLEQDFQEVSDNPPPGLVVLPIIAFVIGMFIFPWPRKYDYD
jgi:hypothetical protein